MHIYIQTLSKDHSNLIKNKISEKVDWPIVQDIDITPRQNKTIVLSSNRSTTVDPTTDPVIDLMHRPTKKTYAYPVLDQPIRDQAGAYCLTNELVRWIQEKQKILEELSNQKIEIIGIYRLQDFENIKNKIKTVLDPYQKQGLRFIHIPMGPHYFLDQQFLPIEAMESIDLSEIIVKLSYDPEEQIQDYFYPALDGGYALPPAHYSDDFIHCTEDTIQKFLKKLADYIQQADTKTMAILHCYGTPIYQLKILAEFLDVFHYALPDDAYNYKVLEEEFKTVFSKLKPNCIIEEFS